MASPEAKARERIDRALAAAGWIVQDYRSLNLAAGRGIAVREFPLATGSADYLLYADARVIGIVEAKPEGPGARILRVVGKVRRVWRSISTGRIQVGLIRDAWMSAGPCH